jgi:hypothetical protein
VYVEAVDFLPGLAGESRNFDSNGPYVRILGALGQTGLTSLQSGLVGGTLSPLVGFEPTVPPGGKPPPLKPNVACETQPPIRDLTSNAENAPTPVTSTTLPSSLGLVPLPLPFGLSADKGSKKAKYQPATAQTMAAARKQLLKTGIFEITHKTPTSNQTAVETSAAANQKSKSTG